MQIPPLLVPEMCILELQEYSSIIIKSIDRIIALSYQIEPWHQVSDLMKNTAYHLNRTGEKEASISKINFNMFLRQKSMFLEGIRTPTYFKKPIEVI